MMNCSLQHKHQVLRKKNCIHFLLYLYYIILSFLMHHQLYKLCKMIFFSLSLSVEWSRCTRMSCLYGTSCMLTWRAWSPGTTCKKTYEILPPGVWTQLVPQSFTNFSIYPLITTLSEVYHKHLSVSLDALTGSSREAAGFREPWRPLVRLPYRQSRELPFHANWTAWSRERSWELPWTLPNTAGLFGDR